MSDNILSIRLRLDAQASSLRKDGTSPIVVHIPFGKYGVDLPTWVRVSAEEWDETARLVIGADAKQISLTLSVL